MECPPLAKTFEEAGLVHGVINYLRQRGISRPTPIQMQGIPCLMNGRDVIGLSPTGSGKTLAYMLPLISLLKDIKSNGPVGVIIVPTRELAQQIFEVGEEVLQYLFQYEQHDLAKNLQSKSELTFSYSSCASAVNSQQLNPVLIRTPYATPMYVPQQMHQPSQPLRSWDTTRAIEQPRRLRHSIVLVCGGTSIVQQIKLLQETDASIVIATPGRLIDLAEKGTISFSHTNYVVLDECDKMLEMGMEEQLRRLVSHILVVQQKRQFSLWSATLPSALERLARSAVVDPITIYVSVRDFVHRNITQNVMFLHTYQKEETLLKVLRRTPYPPVIVFASTIETVDEITELLQYEQFHVCTLHSDKEQEYRFNAISAFRRGKVDVLVATDLASRGLDIPDVTHVINYDIPDVIENYIHRCGRTGRFGRSGMATSFLTLTCKIASELKQLLEESNMPIPKQLEDVKQFGGKVVITEYGDRPMHYS